MGKNHSSKHLVVLLGLAGLTLGTGFAGHLRIDPSSGTRYENCYQPYDIIMDTNGISTNAVDTKIFHETDFSFNTNYTDYITYISGDMDVNSTQPFYTGTTWGNEYTYINTRQLDSSAGISGSNVRIATIYLKPNATGSGYINFYFTTGSTTTWVNGDDSNISSGYDDFTQYLDVLTGVTNGTYDITGETYCPQRPYILTSTYYQRTYVTTATGVERVWTGIIAGPHYLSEYDVSDNVYNKWTHSTWWTVWTKLYDTKDGEYNSWILLTLTGNEAIQMVSVQMFDDPNISAVGDVTAWRIATRQLLITGNIYTGYVTFDNQIWNIGDTVLSGADDSDYNRYTNSFNIDAFWIDTVAPNVGTSVVNTGDGYENILLSWVLSSWPSNATAGWHKTGSAMDDQFAIYLFDGLNTTKYNYDTTTGYNQDLINTYGWNAGTGWTMEKTLNFTQTRSGYVYFIDRAGNTWRVFLDVNIEPAADFIIYTKPAFRENALLTGLSTTGEFWLAYKDGSTWSFTHNSVIDWDAKIKTNYNGTGLVHAVVPVTGKEYLAVFKGSGMLAVGFTGIRTNDIYDTGTNIFDFVTKGNNFGTISDIFPALPYNNENYIKVGDISLNTSGQYDLINGLDLDAINWALTVGLSFNAPNYYDFDINNVINAIEQAIVLEFDVNPGFIDQYADGINYPFKTGFVSF